MRSLTRAQALQNRAFLQALAQTGNTREAARLCGLNRSMLTKRRAKDPVFAAEWEAAVAVGQGAARTPPPAATAAVRRPDYRPVRLANGRVQLRRAKPRSLDRAAEQAFLAALSATANVRLAARAAGFSHSAFYARARTDPGFARELRLALALGYERLEAALIHSFTADAHAHDAWRHNAPPPIPPMTPEQAIQLLTLHQKEVRLGGTPPLMRRRANEPEAALTMRLVLMHEHRMQREREAYEVAEAARRTGAEDPPHAPPAPVLPDLAQVASAKPRNSAERAPAAARREIAPGRVSERRPDVAMFGGWRITKE